MSLEGVMPNNSDKERQTSYDRIYMWNLKKMTTEFIETDSRLGIIMGGGCGVNVKFPVIQ